MLSNVLLQELCFALEAALRPIFFFIIISFKHFSQILCFPIHSYQIVKRRPLLFIDLFNLEITGYSCYDHSFGIIVQYYVSYSVSSQI